VIISFAWTTPSILDRTKTVTRRFWNDDYARKYHTGDIADAYDRLPRAGGKKIGTVRITRDPYKQKLADMSDGHFLREGGLRYWPDKAAFIEAMGGPDVEPWVVEFEIVGIDVEPRS